jgi:cysteine desulfurase / selenocysteine lyase
MIDPAARLRDFPPLEDLAYLSTAAEGLPPIHVAAAINDYWQDKCEGLAGRARMDQRWHDCRSVAASFMGLQADEVSFASSCSEAYNLLATCLELKPSDEVVVCDLDSPSGLSPWFMARLKPNVLVWHQRSGSLELVDLLPLLNQRTRLVQLPLISYNTGYHLPWRSAVEKVRKIAPQAVISVDVTQALGRVPIQHCAAYADFIVSSSHTWALGAHGAAVVGIPSASAERLTPRAGGWRHLQSAFDLQHTSPPAVRHGAEGFGVGTPAYPAIYALHASLSYLGAIGLEQISAEVDPLVEYLHESLITLGLRPLASLDQEARPTGIVAFQHSAARELQSTLRERGVEVIRTGQTLRACVHGYTTENDLNRLLTALDKILP